MRTSGVKLVAETRDYKRDVADAADATDKLADSIDDVAASAPRAKAGLDGTGRAAKATARDVDELKRDLGSLDRQIAQTEAALLSLSKAYARTGDASLLKEVGGQQGLLRQLTSLRKRVADAGNDSAGGFWQNFGSQSAGMIEKLPISPQLAAVVGTAAALTAPLLGAAISGAVIGGAGIGGMAGGLMLAARDSRVQQAVDDVGSRIEGRLNRAAGTFVRPAIDGLHEIEKSLDNIDLEGILARSSMFVRPLAHDIGESMEALGGGIDKLVRNAGPVVDVIGRGIVEISQSLGNGLSQLADNADEGARALQVVFGLVAGSIDTVFMLVDLLTKAYKVLHAIGADVGLELWLKVTGHSMDDTGKSTQALTSDVIQLTDEQKKAAESDAALTAANSALTGSQRELSASIDNITRSQSAATMRADALKKAMDGLYGAAIRQTDANEGYQASWDSLSESIKNNGRSLDIHTRAGRTNRDALEDLLTKSNELYLADIAAGASIAQATKKHEARTEAVKEEAKKVGLNKQATNELISTYGRIPAKKETDLILDGVRTIVQKLYDLYVLQRALAEGRSIASMEQKIRTGSDNGPAKRNGGLAAGGYFDGMLPGPPSRVDNLTGVGPTGDTFGLAGGEYVVNAKATARHRRTLEAINNGEDGFAAGGFYPVDTSRRWPYHIDTGGTKIPSRADVRAAVTPAVPAGGRTDDWIVQVVKAAFPGLNWISKYRPGARTLSGNASYHSMHRAVDWPPSLPLAEWWNLKYKSRTKELITPWQSLNIKNGSRHSYSADVYRQHNFAGGNAHDHIAMNRGGVLTEPVVGVGVGTGRTYSFAETGIETVVPGRPSYTTAGAWSGGGGAVSVTVVNQGVIGSKAEAENFLVGALDDLKRRGRI